MSVVWFRSRLTNYGVIGLMAATAACAQNGSKTDASYAIHQASPDSIDQALVAKFLAEYRQRARPFQQGGNYFGEMQLIQQLAAQYPRSAGVRDLTTQQLGTLASFLGNPTEALRLFDTMTTTNHQPPSMPRTSISSASLMPSKRSSRPPTAHARSS